MLFHISSPLLTAPVHFSFCKPISPSEKKIVCRLGNRSVASTTTTDSKMFEQISIPKQKSVDGALFPVAVGPSPGGVTDLSTLERYLVEQGGKAWLESHFHDSGALLLRGFPINDASDFNRLVEAFGYEDLPYDGAASRTNVIGRVYTANESPPDQKVYFHHEMFVSPVYPSKLFFYCEVEPASGGETPIVLSHLVYDNMKEKYPDFVEKLEQHGLLYVGRLGIEDDFNSPVGRGWQSLFQTRDKTVAEERAAQMGMRLEWLEDGVKTIVGPIPGVRVDEARGRKVWFNGMVPSYIGWKNLGVDPRNTLMYGDGSPLPADAVDDCGKLMEEECVAFSWKKGDVLLIDNIAVQHSRLPWQPPRRVLASFCM